MSERRCPNCGGLVAEGVEFCQQCFQRMPGSQPAPAADPVPDPAPRRDPGAVAATAAPPSGAGVQPPGGDAVPSSRAAPIGKLSSGPFHRAEDGSLFWTCPSCELHNAIEAMACLRCGTPFRSVFGAEEQPPKVSPERATRLSMVFPGLGHHALGRTAEGLSRAIFFLWSFGTAIAILLIRRGQGLGQFGLLIAILGLAAVVLYATSVVDAGRAARRQDPVLSTRMLLYGGAGVMLLTVGMMLVQVLGARR